MKKNRRQKQLEKNTTYAEIAAAAINQTTTHQCRPPPTITLTNKTHLKMTELIIEAHFASIQNSKLYGDII